MKSTQGWGWLTAGVLALGLNRIYHDGGAAWAHRISSRVLQQTESLGTLASVRGDRFLEQTNVVVARDETATCRLGTAMARFQTKIARSQNGMAHFEAMSARQEAALARMEANRSRIEAQVAGVRLAPVAFDSITIPEVACPRVRVPRVSVSVPMVKIPAPVVEVEMGAGPI
jgi:hypothetical protein